MISLKVPKYQMNNFHKRTNSHVWSPLDRKQGIIKFEGTSDMNWPCMLGQVITTMKRSVNHFLPREIDLQKREHSFITIERIL